MGVTQLNVSLPDDHVAAIHEMATEIGIDLSQVVERAVRMYQLARWQAQSDKQSNAAIRQLIKDTQNETTTR